LDQEIGWLYLGSCAAGLMELRQFKNDMGKGHVTQEGMEVWLGKG
jgi:hypothetical protein